MPTTWQPVAGFQSDLLLLCLRHYCLLALWCQGYDSFFFLSTSQLTWGSCGVWAQLQHSRQGEGCLFPEVRLQASRIQNWAHTTTETRGGKMVASHFLGATDGHLLITCGHMKESLCFTATVIWMHKPTRKQSLSSTCVNLISFTVAG